MTGTGAILAFTMFRLQDRSGNRTAYQVTPSRLQFPQEHADSVQKAIDQIDLQKLFVNEDPFLTSPNNA